MSTSGEIVLRIAGQSEGKQRHGYNAYSRHAYTPPANNINENDVRAIWREVGEPRIEDDCAIWVSLLIGVVRPKGHFRKDGSLSSTGRDHPVPRTRKPDIDNALKLVMDALNTRAWRDDVRVAKADIERVWMDWPETVVTIRPYYGRGRTVTSDAAPGQEALQLPL